MRKIGMTGGVGSGKSEVLRFLREEYGAVVLMADEISHEQMLPGSEGFRRIIEEFGEEILEGTGSSARVEEEEKPADGSRTNPAPVIDRTKLAAIVFSDPEKLEKLNGILHPAVKRAINKRFQEEEEKGTELLILEAALLLQDGYPDMLDEIWCVYVDPETRISRLMGSRGYTREKCLDIMKNQLPEEAYRAAADVVIDNSGSWEETVRAIRGCLGQQKSANMVHELFAQREPGGDRSCDS